MICHIVSVICRSVQATFTTFRSSITNEFFYIKLRVSQTKCSTIMITKNSNRSISDDYANSYRTIVKIGKVYKYRRILAVSILSVSQGIWIVA